MTELDLLTRVGIDDDIFPSSTHPFFVSLGCIVLMRITSELSRSLYSGLWSYEMGSGGWILKYGSVRGYEDRFK